MKSGPGEAIRERVAAMSGRLRWKARLSGISASAALLLLLMTLLLYVDVMVRPDSLALMGFAAALLTIQILALHRWILESGRVSPNPLALARKIEELIPAFSGRLVAALEERREGEIHRLGYSRSLLEMSDEGALSLLERLRGGVIERRMGVPGHGGFRLVAAITFSCLLALAGGLLLGWPAPLGPSIARVSHPLALYRLEREWDLEVYPGDAEVMAGDTLTVELYNPRGRKKLEPYIHITSEGEPLLTRAMAVAGGPGLLFNFGAVHRPFRYSVSDGRRRSPLYSVRVVERPYLTEFKIRVIPPDYTGLSPREVANGSREVTAWKGGRVEVAGTCNRALHSLLLDFGQREDVALHSADRRVFQGSFSVAEPDSFHAVLIDREGVAGEGEITYRVKIRPDRGPEVRIMVPGTDRELNRDMIERFRFQADDDFGLLDLEIHYAIESRGGETRGEDRFEVASFREAVQDTLVDFRWDLKGLGLFPGDRIRYAARVRDNDRISGPKAGWSRQYLLTLPTVGEVFSRRTVEAGEVSKGIEELIDEARRLNDSIASLEQEMAASGDIDWEGRREVSEIVRKQEELMKKMQAVSDRLRESAEGSGREGELSPQIQQRVEEISALFQEVATPEMMAALEKLKEALEGIDPSLLKKAMEEFRLTEEEMVKGLEKTYRALTRYRMEQHLDALAGRAEAILGRQETLNRAIERDDEAERRAWGEAADSIAGETHRLMGDIGRMAGELRDEGEPEASRELEEISHELADRGFLEGLGEMAGVIGAGERQRASEAGRKLSSDMQYLAGRLRGTRDGLSKRWKKEVEEEIDRSIADLLILSGYQENLLTHFTGKAGKSPTVDEFLAEQEILLEGTERVAKRLFGTAEETYFIGKEVGRRLGTALNRMGEAVREAESRAMIGPNVSDRLRAAMSSLNGAIVTLMDDRESIGQSASGAGLDEAFQRLAELAGAQGALNDQVSGIYPFPLSGDPGPGEALAREFLRMAAEQERIREGLQGLGDALGEGTEFLGSLDRIVEEMEEVSRDLREGKVGHETLDRQRRIHSRLLDAEKSMRKRESPGEREAERPGPYDPLPVPGLPDERDQEDRPADDGELDPSTWAYPEGYGEVIRLYLEGLSAGSVGEGGER